jgi:hypothetical protein
LLAFAPAFVYFVVAPVSVSLALWLAFAATFAAATKTFVESGRIRLFDAAGFVLFGLLALYDALFQVATTGKDISLVLEAGYLAAALWSMGAAQPFTAQYGLIPRQHDPELFWRANTMLSAVWATTFGFMAAADAATTILHRLSPLWGTGFGLAAFALALTFTWQFRLYMGRRAGLIPVLRKGLYAGRESTGTDSAGPAGDVRLRGAVLDYRQNRSRDSIRHGARNQPDAVDAPARPRGRAAAVADAGADKRVRRRDDPLP